MLGARLVTAALGIPIALGAFYAGGWILALLLGALGWAIGEEAARLLRAWGGSPARLALLAAAWGFPLAALVDGSRGLLGAVAVGWLILSTERLFAAARGAAPADALRGIGAASFTALAIPFLLSHGILIRQGEGGLAAALLVLLATWAADTAAYAVGNLVGGPRLAPRLSPGKTWSGAVAGLLAASAVGFALGAGVRGAACGAGVAIAGLGGDLFESLLKRAAGAKESGTLLPGHGGLYDRFDSLLWALPLGYWLGHLLAR